jgi:uncharacterized membrane protein
MDIYVGVFILILICLALVNYAARIRIRPREREQAYKDYQTALEVLKIEPTNPILRQEALELGRVYANHVRNSQGVTLFDEVALMNDINAVTAGATSHVNAPAPTSDSTKARLTKLSELRANGVITEQEYVAKRQKILDEL